MEEEEREGRELAEELLLPDPLPLLPKLTLKRSVERTLQ